MHSVYIVELHVSGNNMKVLGVHVNYLIFSYDLHRIFSKEFHRSPHYHISPEFAHCWLIGTDRWTGGKVRHDEGKSRFLVTMRTRLKIITLTK